MPELFTLTKEHIKLVRKFYVTWWECETGAPAIDPKRPYGNSDVAWDVAEILGFPVTEEDGYMSPDQEASLLKIHEETQTALQIVLSCGTFEPGVFELSERYTRRSWKRVS
jgi:hypothetical protein